MDTSEKEGICDRTAIKINKKKSNFSSYCATHTACFL